jgi:hypothetical protein
MTDYLNGHFYLLHFLKKDTSVLVQYDEERHLFVDSNKKEMTVECAKDFVRNKELTIRKYMTSEEFKDHVKAKKPLPKEIEEANLEYLM